MSDKRTASGRGEKAERRTVPGRGGKAERRTVPGRGGKAGRRTASGRGEKAERRTVPGRGEKAERRTVPGREGKAERRTVPGVGRQESGDSLRINKYLARCGVCSRRDADALIEQGKVFVNGSLAVSGQQVSPEDEILVGGKTVHAPGRLVVLAFYKPVGVTCTERDAHAEKKIMDFVKYPERVTYAGRLDKDSEGLLLLSNSGDLLQAMMKGANRHEKEYVVRVSKEITADFLTKMSQGVFLRELGLKTRECELEKLGKYTFRIVLTQGVNRQIRRMCSECGYRVESLKRVRVMSVELGKLHPGEYRELETEELKRLCRECGLQQENL